MATSALLLTGTPTVLDAQSVTTAVISGIVTDESARGLSSAQIQVVNRATGFAVEVRSGGGGRYLVQGLEVGGPYSVGVKRIGFTPQTRENLMLTLGQNLRVDFRLEPQAAVLAAVLVRGEEDPVFSPSHTGVGTTVSDSALRRLPTVDRDLYSFVQLTAQVSTGYGLSAGGVNRHFNSILIDGASEQALFNNYLPAGAAFGGHAISIEAVKEYQVLLSPYDVRHGNFAGALINAVTKSGTNDFYGTAFSYFRNERLARNVAYLRESPYDRTQFGLALGGPIVRDRVHFFLAPELQRTVTPATGAYVGQSATPVPADTADISRFVRLLQGYSLHGGSAGPVSNSNPLVNLFARLDLALPALSSRLVLRHNYSAADSDAFSRPIPQVTSSVCPSPVCFPLSSVGRRHGITKHASVAQIYTNFRSGAYNELIAAYTRILVSPTPKVREPLILVTVPHVNGSDSAFLQSGTIDLVQGNALLNHHISGVTDNFTFATGAHRVTVGAAADFYRVRNSRVRGAYGIWRFASLDAFERGEAVDYRVSKDFGGADATIVGVQYGLYVGDQWQLGEHFALTLGLRGDIPIVRNRPPYVASVDSIFGRRTDVIPSSRVQWSPRLGFNWGISGDRRDQLRGGVGMFTGRPPLAWLLNAFSNYGSGIGVLRCNANLRDPAPPAPRGPPPPFPSAPDYRNPPATCANAVGFATGLTGPVNLLNERLSFPQTFRATLAYDRRLPWRVVATLEALYTMGVHDFFFVNRNLKDPVDVDRNGRIMYGTLDSAGVARPSLVTRLFSEVVDLENQSRNHSYNLTGQLEKRFSNRLEGKVAYSFSRVRDVQSHLELRANDAWRFGRALSGRHDDKHVGVSDFDQPHRVVLVGTYTTPWRKRTTDLSVYYVGASGVPYTFTPLGEPLRTGDLNADGSNANDPIYVPRSAFDVGEIRFAPTNTPASAAEQAQQILDQQVAFERFVQTTPCLREQRGRIMRRNSCRGPWVHTANVSVRQGLTRWRGRRLSVQVEVFNVLNLVNSNWGHYRIPNTALLTHVGQTGGSLGPPQAIFRFDPSMRRYQSENTESNYQLQLAARYSF